MSTLSAYTPPNGLRAWLVVLSSALFFFYIFIQMNLFNEMASELIVHFNLSVQQLGNLSAMYFYGTVIFLFPAGILLDRFSVRSLLLLATFFCVLSTAIFSFTPYYWIAAIARFIVGMTASFALLACVKLASRWFCTQHMALVMGICVTIAMLGGVMAQAPFVWLMSRLGWHDTLLVNLVIGGVIFIWLFISVKDYPHDYPVELEKRVMGSELGFWSAIFKVIQNKQNWFAGLYICLINLPLMLLGAVWGSLYLMQVGKLTQIEAANVSSMLFIGSLIGCPIVGWLSDRLSVRRQPMMIGALICCVVILGVIYSPNLSYTSFLILFLLLGLVTSVQVIGYPLLIESNPSMLTARAQGLSSVIIMAGGFLQPVFAWLIETNDSQSLSSTQGGQVNQYADFFWSMWVMPIAFILALIIAWAVKETYCRRL
ncbi:MFS transporter [uncultured Shewanella sp.]|uniref:MFS transporter n=1 Tax=uncultured Shewanella sp. TaxID=173975 RepID=UPI00261D2CD8|nr:MFS transporter [uncultured Shewanella sp.]